MIRWLLIVLALLPTGSARAVSWTFEGAVRLCRAEVRQLSPTFPLFDAYSTAGEEVHMIGTTYEEWEFDKCMAEHGHEMGRSRPDWP